MKTAYLDCFSGISGDMTLGALLDAGASIANIQAAVESMGLYGVAITASSVSRNGFRGLHLRIEHPPEHVHRHLRDIHSLVRHARISPSAKDIAMRIFERIARAEAKVHGTSIDRVHFHEVGAIDSIVDIVGVAIAWDELGIDRAHASAVPTGTGQVKIAHGLVSVPAPATAELLTDIPIAPCSLPFEMTTPTGAAILAELVSEYGPMPPMQVGRIGYGAGTRRIEERPNLLRILIGNALKPRPSEPDDSVCILETNLDDISGEQIGYTIERLWKAGALDVFTTAIQMKKNRPGTLLSVIVRPSERHRFESILFQQTGTLGIRYRRQSRTTLPRAALDVQTPWGVVAGKVAKLPGGQVDFSPEYDDCRRIANSNNLRLADVMNEVRECFYAADSTIPSLTSNDSSESNESSELKVEEADSDAIEQLPLATNRALSQAAVEDALEETIASIASPLESPLQPMSIPTSERYDPRDIARAYDAPLESQIDIELPPAAPRAEFYRWDSAPWNDAIDFVADSPAQPLPESQTAQEFPIKPPPRWDNLM